MAAANSVHIDGGRQAPSHPHPPTPQLELDRSLARVRERAREFARLPVSAKIELLRDVRRCTRDVAADWVAAACRAKGLEFEAPIAGEEWITGPVFLERNVRFLIRALVEIGTNGAPVLPARWQRDLPHGALAVRVSPYDSFDAAIFAGFTAETWLKPEVDRRNLRDRQAPFYKRKDPEGAVSLVLGAGNIAALSPVDVMHMMFSEGAVCVLKPNPVNDYLGPYLERALRPLIQKDYLAIVYGGAEVGFYLCHHAAVDRVHVTGSVQTHDAIVWGASESERADRKKRNDPILRKPITSELGNISPVIVVPGAYSEDEFANMGENIAGMITHNASFNCNAAKLLVLPNRWNRRDALLKSIETALAKVPPRKAYYPGAFERYAILTAERRDVRAIGKASDGALPWTLVLGLQEEASEKHFSMEPFCSVLSEVSVGSSDPFEFMNAAVRFVNERVWGTLNSMLFVHPGFEKDTAGSAAVHETIRDLRYGTVGVNVWPALGYALCSPPWGGHPSSTLADVQSGMGWVNNTVMLAGIEKAVVRGPIKAVPKPIYYPSHKTIHTLGRRLANFEASPSWLKMPGLALAAFSG